MLDMPALMLSAVLRDGIYQYPDTKIYKAATQLKPADRPEVPVRSIAPDPKRYPIFKFVPNMAAISDYDYRGPIFVNNGTDEYKDRDPMYLAAVLAHEAQHYKTGKPEVPAYTKQLDILQHSRLRDSPYVDNLKKVLNKYALMEQMAGTSGAGTKDE